jgi:hypothetical protein
VWQLRQRGVPLTDPSFFVLTLQVRGLGETLVGNYAGRALSAVVQKSNLAAPEVLSFPSKSVGLFVDETLIFRSDSNGEDLDGKRPLPTALALRNETGALNSHLGYCGGGWKPAE